MASGELEITIRQTDEGVSTQIWCPAFVDSADHHDLDQAIGWVRERLEMTDPFEEYTDG